MSRVLKRGAPDGLCRGCRDGAEAVPAVGTVGERSEGSTDCKLPLPAAMLGASPCLPAHENVQFLLLFYFVLEEGPSEEAPQAQAI